MQSFTTLLVCAETLKLAYELAKQGKLVTIGIKPTHPETGYGYIRYAEQVSEGYGYQAHQAERFVEKPNLETAQRYLDDGHYVWNAGIFIWSVKTISQSFSDTSLPCLIAFRTSPVRLRKKLLLMTLMYNGPSCNQSPSIMAF